MTEGLAARIRLCAEIAGSGDELARITAIPRRTLEYYMTGQSEPKVARCVEIAKAVGVDIGWLASGEGEMRPSGQTQAFTVGDKDSFALVPVRDVQVSAGHGSTVEDEQTTFHLAFHRDWLHAKGMQPRDLCCVYARGDSMEPLICNDNLLLVDHSRASISEGIYVLRVDGELFVKRLQRQMNGSVRIISENKEYSEQVIPKAELESLHVIGRVVWVARDM